MAITIPIVSTFNSKGLDAAARDIKKAEGGWAKAGVAIEKAAVPAAATIAVMAAAGTAAVKMASDQEQAFGGLDSVFKDQSTAMQGWAKEQDKVGLSATQAASAATLLGSQLKNMGADTATAAKQSQELVGLGGDLAATFGGPTVDAVDALSAAFKGEFDSLEKYGVSLKASDVAARLAAEGQSDLTGEAKKAAEAAAINAILWEQTTDAQGQAGREAGTTAGQMATLTAKVKNAGASFGEALLPAAEKFLSVAVALADIIAENQTLFLVLAGVIGTVAAAVLVINAAMKVWAAISAVVAAANYVLGTSFTVALGPIGLIILAIAAVIAIGVLLYKNWDKISAFLKKIWDKIKKFAVQAFTAIKAFIAKTWDQIKSATKRVWDAIKSAVSAVFRAIRTVIVGYFNIYKTIVTTAWNVIKKVFTTVMGAIKTVVRTYVNAYKTVITTVFNAIKSFISSAVAGWKRIISTALSAIKSAVKTAMDLVKAVFRGDWREVLRIVTAVGKDLMALVRGFPGRIVSALGNLGRLLYNKGRDLVRGLIDGIKSMLGSLASAAGGLLDKLNPFTASSASGYSPAPSSVPLARSSTPTSRATGGVTINVYDSADPRRTAAVVKRAIEGYDVTQGRPRGQKLATAW